MPGIDVRITASVQIMDCPMHVFIYFYKAGKDVGSLFEWKIHRVSCFRIKEPHGTTTHWDLHSVVTTSKSCCISWLKSFRHSSLWSHQMETFSALLAICAGNSPVIGEFPAKGQWHAELWCFLCSVPEWTVEETIVRLVIRDANAPIITLQ